MTDGTSHGQREAPLRDEQDRIVPLRLQKFLARSGVASRRGSEDLMSAGRVSVNNKIVTELGSKVDPDQDVVRVDGKVITFGQEKIYLMLHKPVGFVTTMKDPQGRETVADLVPSDVYPGLFPVGRLDLDTSGLLLFSTDGELGHRVLHPKHKIAKRYRVTVDGYFREKDANRLREGIVLEDGPTAPAHIEIGNHTSVHCDEARTEVTTSVTCTIFEGRKRQVRRMFKELSFPVITLHRDAFGPLELKDLPSGTWRMLTLEETSALKAAVSIE